MKPVLTGPSKAVQLVATQILRLPVVSIFFFRWEVRGLRGPQDLCFFYRLPPAKDPETRVTACPGTGHCASSSEILSQPVQLGFGPDHSQSRQSMSRLAWHNAQRCWGSRGLRPQPRCPPSLTLVSLSVQ